MLGAVGAAAGLLAQGSPQALPSLSRGGDGTLEAGHLGGLVEQAQDTAGRLWVLSCTNACRTPPIGEDREQLVEIDDRTGAIVRRFKLPGTDADAFALTPSSFWTAHFLSGRITGFSLRTGHQIFSLRLRLPQPIVARDRSFLPLELSYAEGYIWASGARGRVAQIDPRTGRLVSLAAVPDDARATTDRYGTWEAAELSGVGLYGRHGTRLRARPIMQDGYPLDVAMVLSSAGRVWAIAYAAQPAGPTRTLVLAIDPRTGRVLHRVPVPTPQGIVAAAGALYLGGLAHGHIYRVGAGGGLQRFDVRPRQAWLETASPRYLWAATDHQRRMVRLGLPGA